ncbi:MAG: hypothetical protein U0V70_20100 [Terriglobia bacterium]
MQSLRPVRRVAELGSLAVAKMKKVIISTKAFFTIQLCLILISLNINIITFSANSNDTKKQNNLYLVYKIYLKPVNDVENVKRIEIFLKKELEECGFQVVNSPEAADATLSGLHEVEIPLDGDRGDSAKPIYTYELKLGSGELIWKTKIKFVEKGNLSDDNEFAAKILVDRLTKDKKKSINRTSGK